MINTSQSIDFVYESKAQSVEQQERARDVEDVRQSRQQDSGSGSANPLPGCASTAVDDGIYFYHEGRNACRTDIMNPLRGCGTAAANSVYFSRDSNDMNHPGCATAAVDGMGLKVDRLGGVVPYVSYKESQKMSDRFGCGNVVGSANDDDHDLLSNLDDDDDDSICDSFVEFGFEGQSATGGQNGQCLKPSVARRLLSVRRRMLECTEPTI